jgi:hypothetical protein
MAEWVEKEGWLQQQKESGRKAQEKPVMPIPPEVARILNPAIVIDEINKFLTCICFGRKSLMDIKDRMITFRCGCGQVYAYTDSHNYFNINNPAPEPSQNASDCTCTDCHIEITGMQAKSLFEFVGRKLCQACMGKELAS